MSFEDLGVHPALAEALENEGITSPFPIQVATLPDAIKGRDVLGRGQTGSGKTLAFGLAMMTQLAGRTAKPHRPLGLILSPTRELAVQISDVVSPLARRVNLNSQVVAGGLSYTGQIAALKRGVPIIVATPGRLIDLLNKKHIVLDDVEITVLDEADQMADMGFLPVVKEILEQTQADGQRLLFSATLDRDVDSLVKRFLKNPITHSLENEKSRSADMVHHTLVLDQQHKDLVATQIAAREGRTIFFTRTKHGADKLAEKMLRMGVPVGVLHGGKSQGQRTRVLAAFKDGRATALVATDVAARGIHVDDVSLVVHVDPPADHKDYLHRAGRTARAGARGVVVSLATHRQRKEIFGISKRAGVSITEVNVRPSDQELMRITGAQEPSGIPIAVEVEKPGRNDRGSRDRGDRGGFRRGSSSNFKKRSEGGGRVGDDSRDSREDRPARGDKPVRNFRGAAPVKSDRFERPARPERTGREDSRPARSFNDDRPARPARPAREERPAKNGWSKPDKPFRAHTSGKPERFEKSDRPAKFDRFNAPSKPERAASAHTWRAEGLESKPKTGKPAYKKSAPKRDGKPSFRTDKTEKFEKSEKPFKAGAKKAAYKKAAPKKFASAKPATGKGGFKAAPKKAAGKKPRTKTK